jgi:uncharacterized protein
VAVLEVAGPVSVRLRVRGSTPYFDVFARLCDVDLAGHSWNVCDGILRRGDDGAGGRGAGEDRTGDGRTGEDRTGEDRTGEDRAGEAGEAAEADRGGWTELTVPMSSTAHRFGSGHRVRLQLSGGAHPRFARNTGTGEPIATATTASLRTVDIEIAHDLAGPGALLLPVVRGRVR